MSRFAHHVTIQFKMSVSFPKNQIFKKTQRKKPRSIILNLDIRHCTTRALIPYARTQLTERRHLDSSIFFLHCFPSCHPVSRAAIRSSAANNFFFRLSFSSFSLVFSACAFSKVSRSFRISSETDDSMASFIVCIWS